ncbi:MAG: hypothetical protein WCF22_04890, partial [Candidatus Sulfotelmatobacter sp.]
MLRDSLPFLRSIKDKIRHHIVATTISLSAVDTSNQWRAASINAKPSHTEASAQTFSMAGGLYLILRIVAGA